MADDDPADVFAFPDFWKPSPWLNPNLLDDGAGRPFPSTLTPSNAWPLPASRTQPPGVGSTSPPHSLDPRPQLPDHTANPPALDSDGFFKLPALLDLSSLDDEPTTEVDSPQTAPVLEPLHDPQLQDLDVSDDEWLRKANPPAPTAELKAWDSFSSHTLPGHAPLFVTEAGPGAFDAAIASSGDPLRIKNRGHHVVQAGPYTAALAALALGRGSIFFAWDDKTASFLPELERMRIPGYSTDVLQGLQACCLQCGTTTRSLSRYVQVAYKTHPSPVKVALAKVVDTLLHVIQTRLGEKVRQSRSLLQLHSVVRPIQAALVHFKHLVAKCLRAKHDEHVLSTVFQETQLIENGDELLSNVMREVLVRVSEPWMDFVAQWVGVKPERGIKMTRDGPSKGFVKVETISFTDDLGDEVQDPDFVLDHGRMPEFVPSEVATSMFETGRTYRLLCAHHPEHPLCQAVTIRSCSPPELCWRFDWLSIKDFYSKVSDYSCTLSRAACGLKTPHDSPTKDIDAPAPDRDHQLEFFGQDAESIERRLAASIQNLSQLPGSQERQDTLVELFNSQLFGTERISVDAAATFTPHWSLIPLHSFGPLVKAQSDVVNREYLKLLFGTHGLRAHLDLQKQFHLLGNGMFCSRLAHALFDPDLETAERQAGVARKGGVMGLRLDGRDTWPPASSELRLALMGVLTETYLAPDLRTQSEPGSKELLGCISFAVRDLSEEEIDRCMDPGSLEALDFLRLSYKAPAALAPVMTPVILVKYDKVFKLVLRVLRMVYVVGQTFRDVSSRASRWDEIDNASWRFRVEAQHFVECISHYFFDTGIGEPWHEMQTWLGQLESDLAEGEQVTGPSVERVREEHERMLDNMMHILLLRKRQQAVSKLLEDIFNVILKFSKFTRSQSAGGGGTPEGSLELYKAFRKKVEVFITVCRGLSEKGGGPAAAPRNTKGDITMDEMRSSAPRKDNTTDRLLSKLEMSGYYSQARS